MLEISLPALFRRPLPALVECLPEGAEMDVVLVAVDKDAESRELVGVLVYVVEDADPRFGVKLRRALIDFLGVLSGPDKD